MRLLDCPRKDDSSILSVQEGAAPASSLTFWSIAGWIGGLLTGVKASHTL
jgi:hypothetical protein